MTQSNEVETWMPVLVDKYLGDTTHLTTEQHGAYLLLLLSGWKRSGRLPADDQQLANIARMTPQRWKASRAVLLAFFKLDGDAYVQKRQLEELERARNVSAERSKAGKAGAQKRWQDKGRMTADAVANAIAIAIANLLANGVANGSQTGSQNDTPIPKHSSSLRSEEERAPRKRSAAPPPGRPPEVAEQVWGDFLALRAKKRAPVTETVLAEARTEAAKAGLTLERFLAVWCARGSQGLQAEWLKPHELGAARATTRTTVLAHAADVLTGGLMAEKDSHAAGDIIDI